MAKRMRRLCLALMALASLTAPAAAQEWPARPVRIVGTFPAGGAADILARIAAEHLTAVFKQQFFVENRPGAGGAIGVQTVAHAEPDGYNLVQTSLSNAVLIPMINPKVGYETKDLAHIALIAGTPILFAVSKQSDIKSLKDLVAKAKTKPLSYGTSGSPSVGQLVALLFGIQAGLKFENIPYKGAAQSLIDIVANHIDFGTPTVTSAAGQIRGGALTPLAVSTAERMPDYPDIPTFKELGYDVVATNWFALAGPARLPADIVAKINREVNAVMTRPASQQRMREDGMLIYRMDAAAFRAFVDDEIARWRPVVEKAGMLEK
jgi:tripartite-type tricarboxylate transporter receptor subunit TctC